MVLALVCGAAFVAPEMKTANAVEVFRFAEYVSVEHAPIIDGQVDGVWEVYKKTGDKEF